MDSYDATAFEPEEFVCPRCDARSVQRFPGLCPECVTGLRESMRGEVTEVDTEYVPKVNVTANAVALKDD